MNSIFKGSRIITLLCIILVLLLLAGCSCKHEWKNATCTTPTTCSLCGEVAGAPFGHSWEEATCKQAKTCKICSAQEGEPLEHNWEAATCEKAKFCKTCSVSEGEAKGHSWESATTSKPKTCKSCGKTEGSKLSSVSSAVGVYNTTLVDKGEQDSYTIYLNADGSYIFSCSANDEDEVGTWKQQGTTIYCTYKKYDGTVQTDTLRLVTNGLMSGSLYYKKVG